MSLDLVFGLPLRYTFIWNCAKEGFQYQSNSYIYSFLLILFYFQVVLTVSQVVWCKEVADVLDVGGADGIKEFEQKCFDVSEEIVIDVMY